MGFKIQTDVTDTRLGNHQNDTAEKLLRECPAMGLAASNARFLLLTAYKSDLELTGQQVNQARLQLANQTNQLFNVAATLDPNSTEAIQIQSKISSLQGQDRSLELQLRRVDTQQDAVQTEIDAVRKVIDKNIDLIFKVFA